MTARELMTLLDERGVRLSLEGETLRCLAPKGSMAPELKAELQRRKPELIAYLRDHLVPRSSLVRVPRTVAGLPLSFAQQRLWLMSELVPDGSLYNVPAVIRLRGAIDANALESALQTIVARHETLRTVFAEGPLQIVKELTFWMRRAEARDEEDALRIANEEVWGGFDLAHGPLFRALLVTIDDAHALLVLTMHHIVSDGWSMGVLLQELGALYEGPPPVPPSPRERGEGARRADEGLLPALDIQYADFSVWQRQSAERGGLESAVAYWRKRLAGAPELFELPGDRSRPAVQSHRGAKTFATIPLDGLQELARRENATPFMVLLAAFKALLHRYTGRTDVVVGSPIAGRTRAEVEHLIGFFVNTLVLRTEVDSSMSFRALLARVRETCVEAYAHQDAPFDKLVEVLCPQRDLSHHPLFQIVFVLQTAQATLDAFRSVEATRVDVENPTEKFDLTLDCEELDGGIRIRASYNTDLFDRETIDALLANYRQLLAGALAKPDAEVGMLPLVVAAEADTTMPYPRDRKIHELFAEQAARTPNRIAIIDGSTRISYRELNVRASWLSAHYRAECTVVRTPRSANAVIEMLAILKAGGAYVPLDGGRAATGIAAVQTTDLAYVMYTSGSTGAPKGVAVPHRAVVRLVMDNDFATLTQDDVVLHYAPLAFDASTFEIWGALLHGATLVIVRAGATLEELTDAITAHGVTTLWLTAGLFHAMADEQPRAFANVRQLLAGGDVLSPAHVARVLRENPALTIVNGYGPTENTTFTCCHRMTSFDGVTVPIGRPIRNTSVRVLDARMQPVPDGVAGELFAGGDGLAHGYANDAALTAEKFVPAPNGERLYRTGDLVRRRRDGILEFLGRIDRQVKVRGFRIEPGEIEAAMRTIEGIDDAVVIARGDRLVAYYVWTAATRVAALTPFEERAATDVAAVQRALRALLPDYMIPSAIVAIEAMPLTPNGKIDRDALPEIALASRERIAPRDEAERAVAEVWSELLHVGDLGVDDDFFQLGGHSLLATRLVSRLRTRFGAALSLATVFEQPTVRGLAAVVRGEMK